MSLYPLIFIVTALIAYGATFAMRKYSLKARIMDQPNERSLHTIATPRGGGVGVVASVAIATLAWFAHGDLPVGLGEIVALALGMAALGFWDDRVSLTAKVRLRAQLFVALILLIVLQRTFGSMAWIETLGFVAPAVLVSIFVVFFVLWMTNLFNFMDGSDGIAGLQAIMTALGFFVLALLQNSQDVAIMASILIGAGFGFLILNWSPAKIFMGDVGSIFFGFLFAALTIWLALSDTAPFAAALLLQGAFVVDATVTLMKRLARGKKPHEAHRTHVYQRLVQSGWTHGRVASIYGAVNLLWLLPMSIVSAHLLNGSVGGVNFSGWGPWAALALAWLPLVGLALWMRAGEEYQT